MRNNFICHTFSFVLYLLLHLTNAQFNGMVWCNETFNGILNSSDLQYYYFQLNEATPVIFDACESIEYWFTYVTLYDINMTSLLERELIPSWDCNPFISKMEIYLLPGEYILGIGTDIWFNESEFWQITINCDKPLDYFPYHIIHS
eukprot:490665_1